MEPNILILVSCQKVIILKSCDLNSPLHTPNPSIQAIKRKSFNIFILISVLENNNIYLKFDIRVICAVKPVSNLVHIFSLRVGLTCTFFRAAKVRKMKGGEGEERTREKGIKAGEKERRKEAEEKQGQCNGDSVAAQRKHPLCRVYRATRNVTVT